MPTINTVSGAFLVVLAVSYLGVAAVRPFARRLNHVAIPNARSSHEFPIPLGGGVILVVVNVAAWLVFLQMRPMFSSRQAATLIFGGLLVAAVSLIDDLGHVPGVIRLGVQGMAALLVIFGYSYWSAVTLPAFGVVSLGGLGIVVTFLWIVGLTNAYNFMDGIDGMAAGQAIVAGLGWVTLGAVTHHPVLELVGALLAASNLGFLAHNWQPARIFMGDIGATFLGFSFAVLPVIGARYDPRLALAGVLLVWPAVFDSAFTVLRRLRRREAIFSGHRTFLFHRLVAAGWSHADAALLYLALPLAGAFLAFTWQQGNPALHSAVGLAILGLCLSLWLFVRHQERLPAHQAHLRLNLLNRRRNLDSLRDAMPSAGQLHDSSIAVERD